MLLKHLTWVKLLNSILIQDKMLDVRCFTKDLCDLYVFVEFLRRAKRVELDDFASKATKLDDFDAVELMSNIPTIECPLWGRTFSSTESNRTNQNKSKKINIPTCLHDWLVFNWFLIE